MRAKISVPLAAFIAVFWLTALAPAQTTDGGCTVEQVGGTSRHVLRCSNGLSATADPEATYSIQDRNADGSADAITLDRGGLLLEVPSGEAGVEVIAPQAIAAVRGTKWAVDAAQPGRTSVFVVTGQVAVRRRAGDESVLLGAGDGVDVDEGDAPLVVRQWGAARVAALLARFGQ
jgi:hypothetical protein